MLLRSMTDAVLYCLQTRRALYDLFGLYCEEAQTPGQFKNDMRRIIAQGGSLNCCRRSRIAFAGVMPA